MHPLTVAVVCQILRAERLSHQASPAMGTTRQQIVSEFVRQRTSQGAWEQALNHPGQFGKPTGGALGASKQFDRAPH